MPLAVRSTQRRYSRARSPALAGRASSRPTIPTRGGSSIDSSRCVTAGWWPPRSKPDRRFLRETQEHQADGDERDPRVLVRDGPLPQESDRESDGDHRDDRGGGQHDGQIPILGDDGVGDGADEVGEPDEQRDPGSRGREPPELPAARHGEWSEEDDLRDPRPPQTLDPPDLLRGPPERESGGAETDRGADRPPQTRRASVRARSELRQGRRGEHHTGDRDDGSHEGSESRPLTQDRDRETDPHDRVGGT